MRRSDFLAEVRKNPVIAAVKDGQELDLALESQSTIVFVLYGDVNSIGAITRRVRDEGKVPIVHIDLVDGLSLQPVACDFIKHNTQAEGIISTHASLINRARELGLNTVMRFFMIDSMSFKNVGRQAQRELQPDLIEVLPAVLIPDVYRALVQVSKVPVMAGGLLTSKGEVANDLQAGCIAVSTTNKKMWPAKA